MEQKASGNVMTWVAVSCSVFLMLVVCLFLFLGDGEVYHGESADFAETSEEVEKEPEGSLAFTAAMYEIETNQDMDLSKYLERTGVEKEDVSWSSEDDTVDVGSRGHIVMEQYDSSCTIQAVSKKDDRIKASCVVSTRSEEDDFVYQVQSLNGQHHEDETSVDGAVQLAVPNEENEKIDVDAKRVKAGKRNKKYTWDKSLFYRLEEINPDSDADGQINSYRIEKKKFINADTGNVMEYEIYHHPETDKIHKIVSIEYKQENGLKITEYYYTSKGKLNFAYAYDDINYTPSYANPSRDGERYLFHKDALVTWRTVADGEERNLCIGKAEKQRVMIDHANVKLYGDCTSGTRKKYDDRELSVLNAAYNTLAKVRDFEGVSTINGYVNEPSGKGLEDASIELKSVKFGRSLCSIATDRDGYYELLVPMRKMEYRICYTKDNFMDEKLYGVWADVDEINLSQESVYLSKVDDGTYDCELTFYDALNKAEDGTGMEKLYGMDVAIRRGVNRRTGETVFEEYVPDSSVTVSLPPGMYTVEMSGNGYMDTYASLFVSGETGNDLSVYATPKLNEGEYRIVLTWGSIPRDLDSHLFAPNSYSSENEDYHICYYHQSDIKGNTFLDVDDVDGYGPETTTIRQIQRGQYKFYVCDYTNCSDNQEDSMEMSGSGATVRVYGNKGLLQTFYVPVGKRGIIWEVFEMRDGKVIPTQRYYDEIGNRTWWRSSKNYQGETDYDPDADVETSDSEDAYDEETSDSEDTYDEESLENEDAYDEEEGDVNPMYDG